MRAHKVDISITLYLFHSAVEKSMSNTPITPSRRVPVPADPTRSPIGAQPLALELYYLLTAYSEKSYVDEQQAMTYALKWFHENPIIRIIPNDPSRTYRISLEPQSPSELSQLWQSFTVPFRWSVVYKVTTVFIEPLDEHVLARAVAAFDLAVVLASQPFANAQVLGTQSLNRFFGPNRLTDPQQDVQTYFAAPAVVGPGQDFKLIVSGFGTAPYTALYLQPPAGLEQLIPAAWIVRATPNEIILNIPAADLPEPGIYQLRMGSGAVDRSNATPFSIAPFVDPGAAPKFMTADFIVNGVGFVPSHTQVYVGAAALTEVAAAPAAGEFQIALGTLHVQIPGGLVSGLYLLRVIVNGRDGGSRPVGGCPMNDFAAETRTVEPGFMPEISPALAALDFMDARPGEWKFASADRQR